MARYCSNPSHGHCQDNSETGAALSSLKTRFDKLQSDVIDIGGKVEMLSSEVFKSKPTDTSCVSQKLGDVPNYDAIEEITVTDVHATPLDISTVSSDEFVPDIPEARSNQNNSKSLN